MALVTKASVTVIVMIFSISQGPADNSKQVPTLSGQFRQSLDSLMKALSDCQPFFLRCIKPNDKRQPKVNDVPHQPQHHSLPPERPKTIVKIGQLSITGSSKIGRFC